MLSYSYLIIGSFNFNNFTIKSHNITSYGLLANLTNYNTISCDLVLTLLIHGGFNIAI